MMAALETLLRMMLAYYGQRILATVLNHYVATGALPRDVPESPFPGFGGGDFQPLEGEREWDEDVDGFIWDEPCRRSPATTHHGAGGDF